MILGAAWSDCSASGNWLNEIGYGPYGHLKSNYIKKIMWRLRNFCFYFGRSGGLL